MDMIFRKKLLFKFCGMCFILSETASYFKYLEGFLDARYYRWKSLMTYFFIKDLYITKGHVLFLKSAALALEAIVETVIVSLIYFCTE